MSLIVLDNCKKEKSIYGDKDKITDEHKENEKENENFEPIVEINVSDKDWLVEPFNDGYRILKYRGTEKKITIPTTINNKNVYCLGAQYDLNNGIVKSFIGDDVEHVDAYNAKYMTKIENFAFIKSKIISIKLPNSLEIISESVFLGCSNLKNIVIPNKVQFLGISCFMDCTSLDSVSLPKNLKSSLAVSLFQNCGLLKRIVIPEGIESIERDAFLGCKNLSSVVIPNSLKYIGGYAFRNCISLKNIDLKNVQNIFHYCFAESGLESIDIPNTVITMGTDIFLRCKFLKNVKLPNNIKRLEEYVFAQCSSLPNLDIPNTVTFIGKDAFKECHKIQSLVIPKSVVTIQPDAFRSWNASQTITLPYSFSSTISLLKIPAVVTIKYH